MIKLPPGVTFTYEVTINVDSLTDDIVAWYEEQGQPVTDKIWHDHRGKEHRIHVVQYGNGRPSYKTQDGSDHYILRFAGTDASAALLFLIKFPDHVISHNMRELEKMV